MKFSYPVFFLAFFPFLLQGQAPANYTSSDILLQLQKLNTVGSVLYIAAHPDDENTRLISFLANEKHLRTGYLSLTRGDGGQNLIGSEQGVELGIIRTQELLAARRIDGGEQFFTRAYDFGFSKNPDETLGKWNRDSVLADMVWVIRYFKPDVIITRFATDGSGGHGHHTASAILAAEAFEAAADSMRYRDQLRILNIWKTRRLFNNSTARFRDPNADMSGYIKLNVGKYNANLGKGYGEMAAESRSMHKSQGFGVARQRGEIFEYFKPLKGDTSGLDDLFRGMDCTWNRYPGGKSIDKLIRTAIAQFNPLNVSAITGSLVDIRKGMVKLGYDKLFPYHFRFLQEIVCASNGTFMEITSGDFQISEGSEAKFTFSAINRSANPLTIHKLSLPGIWRGLAPNTFFDTLLNIELKENQAIQIPLTVKPSAFGNLPVYTQPFWLNSLPNGVFHIPAGLEPFCPEYNPQHNIQVYGSYKQGFEVVKDLKLSYKWVDPEKGELYRPVVITPPVTIELKDKVTVFNGTTPGRIEINLKAHKDNTRGILILNLPENWTSDRDSIVFSLGKKGEEQNFSVQIHPPGVYGSADLKVKVMVKEGVYPKSIRVIEYDHIPVQTWFPDAGAKLVNVNLDIKKQHIGYIPGAGDEIESCLKQAGYQVTILDDDYLKNGDLSRFQAIITGVRAYNTNPLLGQIKQKINEYIAQGGNLVVQYNTNSWSGPMKDNFGPAPFKITRDRVTDEQAEVRFLLPDHKILNQPHKINAKDFEGWIQERGIYFAGDCDTAYECPLSMNDSGEKPAKGSLIVMKSGKGHFVYTGLAFFRQLPAGVPGAYRLLANLLEL